MSAVKRRVFNVLTVVSLVFCVTTATLWVRSYHSPLALNARDSFSITHRDPLWWIISNPGAAVLCRQTGRDWTGRQLARLNLLGIQFGGSQGRTGDTIWNLRLPYWFLTAVTLVLPLLSVHRHWRAPRRRRGIECSVCGYDLRATPDRL
jgi:hypothetical protein